jgi:hypothetical protein
MVGCKIANKIYIIVEYDIRNAHFDDVAGVLAIH